MSNVVVGTQTAIQQAGSYGFVQGKGGYTKVKYSVTNPAEVAGLLSQLLAFGYSYNVTPGAQGAYTIVEASKDTNPNGETETTEPLAEIWERESVATEKDILQSDLLTVNSILPYRKLLIQKCIDDKTDIDGSLTATEEIAVYNLMAAGVKSVRVFSPVVRRTRITASTYAVKASDTNMGKILSTTQMTTLENAPSTVLFNLPSTATQNSGTNGVERRSGWFKKPARVNQQGDGRWQIVQEYEYDYWSKFLYTDAS